MIALSVELPQTGPEIAAHLLGGRPYGHQVLIREDGAAVFRHKDQMNIECENTVLPRRRSGVMMQTKLK